MGHVLILGATSDIAQALAYKYATEGYDLTLAARQPSRLNALASDLEIRHRVRVTTAEFEALDYDSHTPFYESVQPKPTVAICVFGYLGDQAQAQTDFAEAQKIIATNYTGAVSILSLIANDFEARREGTIIGISSVAGDRGRASNYTYGSAKAGFTTYLSGLRNRLHAAGVQVLTVKPGFVRTQMTKEMTLPPLITATPAQIATAVYRAHQAGRHTIYSLWMWQFIMLLIRHLPEFIFKRLKL